MRKKLLLGCLIALAAILFLPTTMIIIFGMMPTFASFVIDRTISKNRTICVGFMNFAGCFPFLLDLWTKFGERNMENALFIITDTKTIIVMYLLAAGGYAIDLAVTGVTASIIVQQSESRLKAIRKQQAEMIDQWGDKVTGKYRLDDFGFPIEDNPKKHNHTQKI